MPLYVIDKEAVLAFRRNHRRQVIRQRAVKRRTRIAAPRARKLDKSDKQWLDAIERDIDKGEAGQP